MHVPPVLASYPIFCYTCVLKCTGKHICAGRSCCFRATYAVYSSRIDASSVCLSLNGDGTAASIPTRHTSMLYMCFACSSVQSCRCMQDKNAGKAGAGLTNCIRHLPALCLTGEHCSQTAYGTVQGAWDTGADQVWGKLHFCAFVRCMPCINALPFWKASTECEA